MGTGYRYVFQDTSRQGKRRTMSGVLPDQAEAQGCGQRENADQEIEHAERAAS